MKTKKGEVTSKRVAKIASRLLRAPKTGKDVKSVSGSVLTQRPTRRLKKK